MPCCLNRRKLDMGTWMQPLCFFAAEAAAQRDWRLAARALDAASACIQHAQNLQARPRAQAGFACAHLH